ncbi:MAG: TonB-dependent receptor domain-containing protein, partial [Steroidobacteraceae bacterium]
PGVFTGSNTSYLFDLRWRPTDHLSTYLRAASAYRPGGPQINGLAVLAGAPTSFGRDTTWDYEAGAKGQWLDRRLNANAAVYYIDWRNIQLNTEFGPFTLVGNGGNAKSEGVEFDGSYEPLHGLVFGANASYDQAVITSANLTNTAGARAGDPLPFTPKWSGALTGDYSFPIAPSMTGGIGASWTYTGWRYSSLSADPLNTRERLPSYSLLALRGHVHWNRYTLALSVNNVANKQTYSSISFLRLMPGQPVPGIALPVVPRTLRLNLTANF